MTAVSDEVMASGDAETWLRTLEHAYASVKAVTPSGTEGWISILHMKCMKKPLE